MQRTITIDVDMGSWPTGVPVPKRIAQLNGKPYSFEVEDLLEHIAFRTAPPVAFGFELFQYWPLARYLPAIGPGTKLKLRLEWADIDSHQKVLLSDDFGMGLASLLMTKELRVPVDQMMSTTYAVRTLKDKSGSPLLSLLNSGKRGPAKSPDFVGWSANGRRLHVFECKGTQQPGNKLDGQVTSGQSQKNNLQAAKGLVGEKLVIGLYVPEASANKPARCLIADPPIEEGEHEFDPGHDDVFPVFVRAHLASTLHLMGLSRLGNAVANDEQLHEGLITDARLWLDWHVSHGNEYAVVTREVEYPRAVTGLLEPADKTIRGVRVSIGLRSSILRRLLSGGPLDEVFQWITSEAVQAEEHRTYLEPGLTVQHRSGSCFVLEILT